MKKELQVFFEQINHARYNGQSQGHYESFFLRANHPERPLAFWIRYTLFSPKTCPQDAIGELWAVFFNGETNHHIAVKREVPLDGCVFNTSDFEVRIGDAHLMSRSLCGTVQTGVNKISWDLSYLGDASPILLLPFMLYNTKLPAAKSLVALPMAKFGGKLVVNGESVDVTNWMGSQNHNWGSKHTDLYAWGQVAGFDSHPGSFLELATAKLKIGPFWMPAITPMVLRHNGKEHALNGLIPLVRSCGAFDYFDWNFKSETPLVEVEGKIKAPREAFVGLTYFNPPGGIKYCLNTKIASCVVRFRDKSRSAWETLEAKNRAAFEILTDDPSHGIPMVV
jgi:hypothetical protein